MAAAHTTIVTMVSFFAGNANFKSFAQTMIKVGAKYGNIAADSIIYGRQKIRENTLQMVTDVQANIESCIHKAAKDGAVYMVTDMWSDNVVQNSYLKVTWGRLGVGTWHCWAVGTATCSQ